MDEVNLSVSTVYISKIPELSQKGALIVKLSALKLARKFLPEAKKLDDNCLNSFLLVFDNGSVKSSNDAACYGGLMGLDYHSNYIKRTPVAVLNRKQNNTFSEEVNKAYDEWLMNDSPYAMAFSSKKYSTVERYGVHVVDCETPSNIMVGGLIATRKPNEHPWIVRTWWELVNRGVHPNLAYVFGHMISSDNTFKKVVRNDIGSHTSLWTKHQSDAVIENFWLNRPQVLHPPYSKEKTYTDIFATWTDGKQHTNWTSMFNEALKATKKSEKASNNPFNVKPNENSYDAMAAMDSIAYTFNQHQKEMVA